MRKMFSFSGGVGEGIGRKSRSVSGHIATGGGTRLRAERKAKLRGAENES